jgi:hypothetical protein
VLPMWTADHITRDCPKGGAIPLQIVDIHRRPTQAPSHREKQKTENEVVIGILPLLTSKAVVLFDFGATHSFISAKYARRFCISVEPMEVGVLVATPI